MFRIGNNLPWLEQLMFVNLYLRSVTQEERERERERGRGCWGSGSPDWGCTSVKVIMPRSRRLRRHVQVADDLDNVAVNGVQQQPKKKKKTEGGEKKKSKKKRGECEKENISVVSYVLHYLSLVLGLITLKIPSPVRNCNPLFFLTSFLSMNKQYLCLFIVCFDVNLNSESFLFLLGISVKCREYANHEMIT